MAIKDVITSAEWGKKIWLEKIKICPELKQYFHVRPCSGKVTLITTHENRNLNGLGKLSKKKLNEVLSKIIELNPTQNNIEEILTEFNFPANKDHKRAGEHIEQSALINAILREELAFPGMTKEKLRFIGSEVTLSEGSHAKKEIVDIVACDSKNLYFLELKTHYNKTDDIDTAKAQVKRYISTYGKNELFFDLINNYPVDDIPDFSTETKIIGVVVKGFKKRLNPNKHYKDDDIHIYEYPKHVE